MKIFEIQIFWLTIAPTYYALMYILGFIFAWFFLKKFFHWKKFSHLDELFFLLGLGVIIGGRLGFVLLYNPSFYLANPIEIFAIWKGWMSFHWGFLGVILGAYIFCKKFWYRLWNILDILAVVTPFGLALGRIGNYLNNELYGFFPYFWPFAMKVWENSHFPSPLGQMLLEGWILFFVMLFFYFRTNIKNTAWKLSGIFLIGYALARIFMEFFRLPDANIWYLFHSNFFTLWMLYSLPMLVFGVYLILRK